MFSGMQSTGFSISRNANIQKQGGDIMVTLEQVIGYLGVCLIVWVVFWSVLVTIYIQIENAFKKYLKHFEEGEWK